MFESNFPVDKVSFSQPVLFNAFKRFSKPYSASERAALFHGTARPGLPDRRRQTAAVMAALPHFRWTKPLPTGTVRVGTGRIPR